MENDSRPLRPDHLAAARAVVMAKEDAASGRDLDFISTNHAAADG